MRYCKDCAHYKRDIYSLICASPKNMTEASLVTGRQTIKVSSPYIQRQTDLEGYCGTNGLWWEKKNIRWWQFWKL
jgi:hypothetical protein